MTTETMCTWTSKYHGLPHWKYVLRCWDMGKIIVPPGQYANKDTTHTGLTIRFHVYLMSQVALLGKYGAINAADKNTLGYYVIK